MSLDRISNMISSLKNASMAKKPEIEVMYTKQCDEIAKVLKSSGFLTEVRTFKPEKSNLKMLHLELSADGSVFKLTDAKRISKPGRRIYRSSEHFTDRTGGVKLQIVSTPKGIMSGIEAKKLNLGGEVLCEVF